MKVTTIDIKDKESKVIASSIADAIYEALILYTTIEEKTDNKYIKIVFTDKVSAIIKMLHSSTDESFIVNMYLYAYGTKSYLLSGAILHGDVPNQIKRMTVTISETLCTIYENVLHDVSKNITISHNLLHKKNQRQFYKLSIEDPEEFYRYLTSLNRNNDFAMILMNIKMNIGTPYEVATTYKLFIQYNDIFGEDKYSINVIAPKMDPKEGNYCEIGVDYDTAIECIDSVLVNWYRIGEYVKDDEIFNIEYYSLREEDRYV